MGKNKETSRQRSGQGGKFLPTLCSVLGTLILVAVIAVCVPITLPKLMGYHIYNVVSGSMEPEIPVGSVIFVRESLPEEIQEKDVIAFWREDVVVAHRVVRNQVVEGWFETKGDANAGSDMNKIPYDALIGRVTYHIPILGGIMALLTSTVGKVYMVFVAAIGAMLNILAGRMKEKGRMDESGRGAGHSKGAV